MENNKNRTDMIAAGRKKLEQFRQKKDSKIGGSPAKSSGRGTKIGNDGENEELSKLAKVTSDLVDDVIDDNISDASSSETHKRAEKLRLELEKHPVDFGIQEAYGALLEKSNVSLSAEHDLIATFPSCFIQEADGIFTSLNANHDDCSDNPSASLESFLSEISEKPNINNHQMKKGVILVDELKVTIGSTGNKVTNPYFRPVEESRDGAMKLSYESIEGDSIEKIMEKAPSFLDILANDEGIHLELGENNNVAGGHHLSIDCSPAKDDSEGRQPVEAVSDNEIIMDAHDRLSSVQEYNARSSSIGGRFEEVEGSMKGSSVVEFERFKRHLYLSSIEKDILQFQLVELTHRNEGFYQDTSHDVCRLFELVMEAQESKERVTEELVQCKSELQHLAIMKDQVEATCLSLRNEFEHEHGKCWELKNELYKSQEDLLQVSKELNLFRGSVDALQSENSNLLASLLNETHGRMKLVEEVELLSNEKKKLEALMTETDAKKMLADERELPYVHNKNLLSELTENNERLQMALEKNAKLQDNLRELESSFEHLTENNFYHSYYLDIHTANVKEMETRMSDPSNHCTTDFHQPSCKESTVDDYSGIKLESNYFIQDHISNFHEVDGNIYGSNVLLKALKDHFLEGKSKLQNLEKCVQMMHFHSISLSRSVGVPITAGVSKLIKAFESKSHHVENDVDEVPLIVGERPEDSYALSRNQILSLSDTFNMMESELGKFKIHIASNQHNGEALMKYKMDCETLSHKNSSLQFKFDELAKKLVDIEFKIIEIPNNVNELHQHVNAEAAGFLDILELFKREVSQDVFILKQERDATSIMILEAVEKLDASTGLKVFEYLDTRSHVMASVDAGILAIEKLHGKVEEITRNYNTVTDLNEELKKSFMNIQVKHALASKLFNEFYINLMELINEPQQSTGDTAIDDKVEKMQEVLPEKCKTIVNYLQKLLNERVYLLSRNADLDLNLSVRNQMLEELNTQYASLVLQSNNREGLESALLNKEKEIQEVKRRCFLLVDQLKDHDSCKHLFAYSRRFQKDIVSNDANDVVSCNSLLFSLEEHISFHLNNCDEICKQVMLLWKHLQDDNMLLEVSDDDSFLHLPVFLSEILIPKVIKVVEMLKVLTVSNLQKETEIQVHKEGMSKIEENLEASRLELQFKVSEVDQLELKLSSVREKLSIAVAKGKGLILQRDNLKQSLMQKNGELEKSTQDLFIKEELLDELEKKLNSCSEVERIEALESELSYIRNSAAALRDSFLQKDSVLLRIEEVLEDLELSDDFHNKDIVEKIEMLARFTVDHTSSAVTELEQRNFEEQAYSYAGGIMAPKKDSIRPCSSPDFDTCKQKHEELQGQYYGLSEHNQMLEQSLLERSDLMMKWEDILNRINMPFHIQKMEPTYKIEWLGKELVELNEERDSLQQKIDNLETSSDMLIVDIEESHKKISELSAEVLSVKSEKQFFSEMLEKLRFEYIALSEKAARDEQDSDILQNELDDLQDKLINNAPIEYYRDMENNLQKLLLVVHSTVMESDKNDLCSGSSYVEHLEVLLKKLIDNYTANLHNSGNAILVNEALLGERSSDYGDENSLIRDKLVPEESLHDKGSAVASLSLELDRNSNKLSLTEQDRDVIFVKYQLETEDLKMQVCALNLEKNADFMKYKSLTLEAEDLKILVDALNLEKRALFEKYQSSKLEVDDLMTQVDALNLEKNADIEKYHSLLLNLEDMGKQRDFLQEQFTHEEQKTASLKEKLNLAVRKGKGLVQQRDNLKQTVDEMNAMVEQLKVDQNQQIDSLIFEKSLLMSRLADVELKFQDSSRNSSRLLATLHSIDLESASTDIDPVQKLEALNSKLLNLRSLTAAAGYEASKHKRAADLLLSELNEVQERNDNLQDELVKANASLEECYNQKNDSTSHLEHCMSGHLEERNTIINNLATLTFAVYQLRECLLGFSRILSDVLGKDAELFRFVEVLREFTLDELCNSDYNNQPFLLSSLTLSHNISKVISQTNSDTAHLKNHQHLKKEMLFEQFALADQALHECLSICNELKEYACEHSAFLDKKIVYMPETIDAVKRKNSYLEDTLESRKRDIAHIESMLKDKDSTISSMYKNLNMLYEACSTAVMEDLRKSQFTGSGQSLREDAGKLEISPALPIYGSLEDKDVQSINDHIKKMAEPILSIVNNSRSTNELVERMEKDLKSTILELQRELQEKDFQMNRVCEELASQINCAMSAAKRSMADLDSSKAQFTSLEKTADKLKTDKSLLEFRLNELQDVEALSNRLQDRVNFLTENLSTKDQEIETLMEALDEEEAKVKALLSRNEYLENLVQHRVIQLETLESSHTKAVAKLSTTVSKFDELHNLSENLLSEVENLQSQLSERDSEISFLRQEVTRCTNDLLASQESLKKYSSEVHELLSWMITMMSHLGGSPVQVDNQEISQIQVYINAMEKKIVSTITELEELRGAVLCKDALLETERGRVAELVSRANDLENSLCIRDRLELSQVGRGSEQQSSSYSSETLEIEQVVQRNKASAGPFATIVRGGRKVNNDQIAIAIDSDKADNVLNDDDDDKSHGFKSLTMSWLVPRVARPIVDRIDGTWVSVERLLMRQPTLRLTFLMYWIAIHALLASFI